MIEITKDSIKIDIPAFKESAQKGIDFAERCQSNDKLEEPKYELLCMMGYDGKLYDCGEEIKAYITQLKQEHDEEIEELRHRYEWGYKERDQLKQQKIKVPKESIEFLLQCERFYKITNGDNYKVVKQLLKILKPYQED